MITKLEVLLNENRTSIASLGGGQQFERLPVVN